MAFENYSGGMGGGAMMEAPADYHISGNAPEGRIGTGLLGATVPLGLGGGFDPKRLNQARLLEIERRILAIEARLGEPSEAAK